MSTALPEGWTAYKTADGKEYYYHAQTKVTQWNRPKASAAARSTTKTASSEPVSTPPLGGGGGDRGSLLAQISQGTKLKKTVTRESSPLDAVKSSSSSSTSSSGGSSSGGGGGNPLFAAIAQGAAGLKKSTHRTPSMRASEQPSPTDTSSSSGGFAEIMRKNREAAAKKAGSTDTANTSSGSASPVLQPSYSAASVVRQSLASMAPASSTTDFADQLNRIEAKLDRLLAHLNISE